MIGEGVLAEVAGWVRSKDLKFHIFKTCWRGCLSFKETRFAGIIQTEFL
jgi:hypothetical protein